jgi:hypothetical protein
MPTDRSDKLHSNWRDSTEKFDYFILGIISALCAFIGQGYKPTMLGVNPSTLELIALLLLVLAAVSGFRRIEKTLLATLINHKQLHAYEARGGMITKIPEGKMLINEATGQIYTPQQAGQRVADLTKSIEYFENQLKPVSKAAERQYHLRNALTLIGFLLLLCARIWGAYP